MKNIIDSIKGLFPDSKKELRSQILDLKKENSYLNKAIRDEKNKAKKAITDLKDTRHRLAKMDEYSLDLGRRHDKLFHVIEDYNLYKIHTDKTISELKELNLNLVNRLVECRENEQIESLKQNQ